MSATLDFAPNQHPHRKPLPNMPTAHTNGNPVNQSYAQQYPPANPYYQNDSQSMSTNYSAPPLQSAYPQMNPSSQPPAQYQTPYQQQQQLNSVPTQSYAPARVPSYQPQQLQMQYQQQQELAPARRTLSNATTSTTSSQQAPGVPASSQSYASSIRRSTSSRSTNASATSYVALMRKQKATVWCDRAQYEDPRMLAQLRAAKLRAAKEVVGAANPSTTRTSTTSSGGITGGVRNKIRHHGAVKASAYNANLGGAGVPMRLSATEIDEDGTEDERDAMIANYGRTHERNGSGPSSMGSGNVQPSSMSLTNGHGHSERQSMDMTTPLANASRSSVAYPSRLDVERPDSDYDDRTPVPRGSHSGGSGGGDYFAQGDNSGHGGASPEEKGFGRLADLPLRREPPDSQLKVKSEDELRRRGSVDDRTMTMSGVRLFVANPDLSD